MQPRAKGKSTVAGYVPTASRLVSDGMWALGGRAVTGVTGIAANALLARILNPDQVGIFFIVASVTILGSLLAQGGMDRAVVRLVAGGMARHKEAEVRRSLRGVLVLGAGGVVLVDGIYLAGGGSWLSEYVFHSAAVRGLIVITASWLLLRTAQTLIAQTLRGFHDLKNASMIDGALSGTVFVLLLIGLLAASEYYHTLECVLTLAIFAFGCAAAAGMALLRKHWQTLHLGRGIAIRDVWVASFPLWISSAAMTGAAQLHLWILGASMPADQVALYGAALRLIQVVAMPLMLMNNVIAPTIARYFARQEIHRIETLIRVTAAIATIPGALLLIALGLFAGPVMSLLFGSFYSAGSTVLIVLAVGQAVNVLTGSPGVLLAMSDRQQVLMVIGLIASAVGLLTSALLVRPLGAAGVALGYAASLVVQNVAASAYCRSRLGVRTYFSPVYLPVAISHLRNEITRRQKRGRNDLA